MPCSGCVLAAGNGECSCVYDSATCPDAEHCTGHDDEEEGAAEDDDGEEEPDERHEDEDDDLADEDSEY